MTTTLKKIVTEIANCAHKHEPFEIGRARPYADKRVGPEGRTVAAAVLWCINCGAWKYERDDGTPMPWHLPKTVKEIRGS